MKPSLYIETSVIGYLTGRAGRDLVVAAHQQLTAEWWQNELPKFEPFVSALVLDEAARGDPEAGRVDSLHVAVATRHGMDYMVSWNCKHIANGRTRKVVEAINMAKGIGTPTICTPEELMEF